MDTDTLTRIAVTALEDVKGKEIVVLDVRGLTSLFERMIIASGDSSRQVKALAERVEEQLKAAGATILGIEGKQAAEWILVDAGDVVVHIMHPAARAYYNLEALWGMMAREQAAA